MQGHTGSHECPYDHKCKEKCQICIKIKCNDDNCKGPCKKKAGHENEHLCEHFHSCLEKCEYFSKTTDCKEKCCLEFNHKGNHRCEANIHHCKEKCLLHEEANNCGQQCVLEYPHEGKDHNCTNLHKCKKNCSLVGKRNCKTICKKEYNHDGDCDCGEAHYCVDNCFHKDKANNCGGECVLQYPHEGKAHNCNQLHKCKKKCSLVGKKNCKTICKKEYDHDGNHDCGEAHYCIDNCFYKDIANNCSGTCVLPYPHDSQQHNCNQQHKCKGVCSLKDKSISCNQNCSLPYGHTQPHKCDLEDHKCNKNCSINPNCNKRCSLPADHANNCLCGECTCPLPCKFKNCSRNCHGNCSLTGGHKEGDHKCQQAKHLCNAPCKFKNISSSGCNQNCKIVLEEKGIQHKEHICENPKENHKCSKTCDLSDYSNCGRNGRKYCNLCIEHQGIHICDERSHICKGICHLKPYSRDCNEYCCITYTGNFEYFKNHIHKCSKREEDHKCNKICNYYIQLGVRCNNYCKYQANHTGPCICPNNHICNQICRYHNNPDCNGCQEKCVQNLGHTGYHICRGTHKCTKYCSYRGARIYNGNRLCDERCTKNYPHNGNHICAVEENNHKCTYNCRLYGQSKRCHQYCKEKFLHSGEHLCYSQPQQHLCNKECFYPDCHRECCKPYLSNGQPHQGKCKCFDWEINPYYHSLGIYTIFLIDRSGSMQSRSAQPTRKYHTNT